MASLARENCQRGEGYVVQTPGCGCLQPFGAFFCPETNVDHMIVYFTPPPTVHAHLILDRVRTPFDGPLRPERAHAAKKLVQDAAKAEPVDALVVGNSFSSSISETHLWCPICGRATTDKNNRTSSHVSKAIRTITSTASAGSGHWSSRCNHPPSSLYSHPLVPHAPVR